MPAIFNSKIIVCMLLVLAFAVHADPTRPPAAVLPTAPQANVAVGNPLQLQLIMYSEQGMQALINGQLLRVGDSIAKFRVQSINTEQVVLVSGSDRLQLDIINHSIKEYDVKLP